MKSLTLKLVTSFSFMKILKVAWFEGIGISNQVMKCQLLFFSCKNKCIFRNLGMAKKNFRLAKFKDFFYKD